MKVLFLTLFALVAAEPQWNPNPNPNPVDTRHHHTPVDTRNPNPAPAHHNTPHNPQPAAWNQPAHTPAAARGVHEVQPAPAPGPFVHKDFHPPPVAPIQRPPIGNVEQRLRRIEVFLNLIDPVCTNPPPRLRELRRMTYAADVNFVYHASEPEKQDTARRAGYTQEVPIGRVATESYDPSCECLIPLYRRNFDNHVYRIDYRTKDTYPCRRDFLTPKDTPLFDYQGDLKNWAIEGYCVPYRGACGANLQLSRMVPTKKVGDDRPLVLLTADEDRVKWGYEKGWDENTLCYIWNP